jgi:hypothetical protein
MRKLELTRATNSLVHYARELENPPVILTDRGRAVAALLPFDDADLESMALSLDPNFNAVIERAREEYRNGASLSAEVLFGLSNQDSTKVVAVQQKRCGSTKSGFADEEVSVSSKMSRPGIGPGVEKGVRCAILGIDRLNPI